MTAAKTRGTRPAATGHGGWERNYDRNNYEEQFRALNVRNGPIMRHANDGANYGANYGRNIPNNIIMTALNGRSVMSASTNVVGPSAITNRVGPHGADNGGGSSGASGSIVSRDVMELKGSELEDAHKRKRSNMGTSSGAGVLFELQTTTIGPFLLAGPGRQDCQEL